MIERSRRLWDEMVPPPTRKVACRLTVTYAGFEGESALLEELDRSVLHDEGWASVAKLGTDDPSVFSAYLRALRWNTATAADRDLFQAPFSAGIHQDAYQLLPLHVVPTMHDGRDYVEAGGGWRATGRTFLGQGSVFSFTLPVADGRM